MNALLNFLKNGKTKKKAKKEALEPKKEEKIEAGMDKKSLKAYEKGE